MLEEVTYPDKIEIINPSMNVQVRMTNLIKRDGEVIAQSFSRYVLEPGSDLTGQPDAVAKVCLAVWG